MTMMDQLQPGLCLLPWHFADEFSTGAAVAPSRDGHRHGLRTRWRWGAQAAFGLRTYKTADRRQPAGWPRNGDRKTHLA